MYRRHLFGEILTLKLGAGLKHKTISFGSLLLHGLVLQVSPFGSLFLKVFDFTKFCSFSTLCNLIKIIILIF